MIEGGSVHVIVISICPLFTKQVLFKPQYGAGEIFEAIRITADSTMAEKWLIDDNITVSRHPQSDCAVKMPEAPDTVYSIRVVDWRVKVWKYN